MGTMPSYEEAARAILGNGADEHLRRFDRVIEEQPAAVCWANAWITARREQEDRAPSSPSAPPTGARW